jgi:hypothetical protein
VTRDADLFCLAWLSGSHRYAGGQLVERLIRGEAQNAGWR